MAPPPAAGAAPNAAHVLSLVKSASTLRRDDIEGLATALLDLGGEYEAALRTVMSMQRLLERVRRSEDVSAESGLLLQEMSRQVAALNECSAALTRCLDNTRGLLSSMKGDPGE
jgi:hypothetical protein